MEALLQARLPPVAPAAITEALVLHNPAFGVPMDFFFCVGWGFGLPTAVNQLTGASAREALGVTLPKVGA